MRTSRRGPRALFALACGLFVVSAPAVAPPAGAAPKGEKQHWSAPTHIRSAGRGAPTGMSCGPKRTCWLVDDENGNAFARRP
ncbi:MAG TPA: hypothetical protein VH085_04715 [Nocardioides sp.]|nr:hypothetical protein [Nocardioides sp.]